MDFGQLGVDMAVIASIISFVQILKRRFFVEKSNFPFFVSTLISAVLGIVVGDEPLEMVKMGFYYAAAAAYSYEVSKSTPILKMFVQGRKASDNSGSLYAVVFFLLFSFYSIDGLGEEPSRIKEIETNISHVESDSTGDFRLALLGNVAQFGFDGSYQVFESPFAVGVSYARNWLDVGVYLAPSIEKDVESGTSSRNLSVSIHAKMFQQMGIGIGYGFWLSGRGVVPPRSNNLFLNLGFNIGIGEEE